jgi:hypothetical protein
MRNVCLHKHTLRIYLPRNAGVFTSTTLRYAYNRALFPALLLALLLLGLRCRLLLLLDLLVACR